MLVPQREAQRRGLRGLQHHLSSMGRPTSQDSYAVQLDGILVLHVTSSAVQQNRVALGNGGPLIKYLVLIHRDESNLIRKPNTHAYRDTLADM